MRTSIYVYTATKSIKPVTDYGAYIFAWTKDDGTPGTQARIFEVENRNAAMAEIALLAAAFKKLDSLHREPPDGGSNRKLAAEVEGQGLDQIQRRACRRAV